MKLLQQVLPGELYLLASRSHIMQAINKCDVNMVVRAEWNTPDKTILTLACMDGANVTISEYGRISIYCDCRHWTPDAQCPHTVITWIQLKRLLSPGSFPHVRISGQVLRDLAGLAGISGLAPLEQIDDAVDPRPPIMMSRSRMADEDAFVPAGSFSPPGIPLDRKRIRLVLEDSFGRLCGSIKHDSEQLHRWTNGVPPDIAECLQRLPYYESKIQYLSTFMLLTNGSYPIVYRDLSGVETPLAIRADLPKRACLTFALADGLIVISRTIDGNNPLPENFITSHELLLDPDAGMIHPLLNREVWTVWDNIQDKLLNEEEYDEFGDFDGDGNTNCDFDDGYDDSYDDFDSNAEGPLQRGANRIIVTPEQFNALALRLDPRMLPDFSESVIFYHDAAVADISRCVPPTYLLELPATLETPVIEMVPLVACETRLYSFAHDLFRFFDPRYRSGLSGPLKAKKRVRTIMETCFELATAETPSARKNLIRSALSGPDYVKRRVKSDARQLLTAMAEESIRQPLMVQAANDGWIFAKDDRLSQIRMLQILYELFGVDAFDSGSRPGELNVRRDDLLPLLPDLAGRLQRGGFLLLLGNEPLQTANWDFALDATSSSLDWFELRPEIRCDGELLKEEELQRLASAGILQRDGRMILLDDINARILAMLTGTAASGKRRKKGEQQAVRIPRLQILDWLRLRRHGVTVRLAPDDARVMESLLNFDSVSERPLPSGLIATLRPYQRDGYRWLGFLYEHRFGACLADDMGLGKTVQGISLLAGIADGTINSGAGPDMPHLIVVPPSLLFNWESELTRFFPGASLMSYTGSGRSTSGFAGCDIVLTSYGIVQRDIDKLTELRFNVIIFDEAQTVKNLQAATSGAVRRLNGAFKLALTGTPVENRVEEYYAIMDLCLPGLLGTPEEFSRTIGNRGKVGIDTLLNRTRPFLLRRNKQLIVADLPDKIETDIHLELSPRQKVFYQRTVEEVRKQIEEAFANRSPGQARIIALTAILRLRQICLAPVLALPGAPDSSPKLEFLLEQLAELRDEGHCALVFSQFTSYLDIVEAGLKKHGFLYLRLDGSTPVPQRKNLVNSFQNSEIPIVFLISLKAGGKGLNLTRATYVYHLDPWWNPAVENQASDRAHRIGQTRQVTITRLVMRHTIEEKMMLLKEQKLKLYKAILDEGAADGGAGLTREDFDFLLG
ncbi:MAG: hypothetical protein A2X82_01370 [Geobacteraceae bacterium GWC2_55_20]|nr:MAG: hypothetical protein A2X82_01370 [Geobacteraceae bacterium GWC2_55_20]